MAKGVRLRLLMQAGVFVSSVDPHGFVEGGSAEEKIQKIPYDPDLLKALVASGRLG